MLIMLWPVFSIANAEGAVHAKESKKPVCTDWATLELGEYEINNDVWGKRQVQGYSQCIFGTMNSKTDLPSDFGWYWYWPKAFDGVKSYPSILYGRNPWNTYSTTLALPREIDKLRHIFVSYKLRSESTGAVNLLLESWITRKRDAAPEDRVGELAIQLFQIKWPGQEGHFIRTIKINGIPFDFYVAWKSRAPGDNGRWVYYGFVHKAKTVLKANIDIMQFVNYLVSQGYLDRRNYLATVELGNEVDHGEGRTDVEHYSVKIISKD